MFKLSNATGVFTLGVFCCASFAEAQESQPSYSRDICVKVRDGKGAEYAAFLRDTTVKLAKIRVEAGLYSGFVIGQAVAPAGRSARCDYHIVYGYNGFPSENPGAEQTSSDMKKAGIAMTREEMNAKRDDLSYLVGIDIWRGQQAVGRSAKGGFARLNYYKTKPGATLGEWVRMESTGWKPVAESFSKELGTAWVVFTLAMPGGTGLPYNGLTVDIFPSWEALGKGVPARATWNKVHPEMDFAAYGTQMANIAERPRIDTVRLVEVIQGK